MDDKQDKDATGQSPARPATASPSLSPEPSSSPQTGSKEEPKAAAPRRRGPPRDELTADERAEIIQLHRFYGTRRIRPRVGRCRKVVRRVLQEEGELGEGRRPTAGSKLDPYRKQIEEKAAKGITTSRIQREIRQEGYSGKRTILATFVRGIKRSLAGQSLSRVKRRFETAPGVEMQIDWSPYKVLISGVLVAIHVLGCLRCSSRKLFVAFFRNERISTLLEGLARAFEYFGGCSQRVVLDNMATAVLCRIPRTGKPILHPRFAEFARYYGFQPYPCMRRDPNPHAAQADRTYKRVLRKYVKPELLFLDEFAYEPFDSEATSHLFRIVSARHKTGSIIIAANCGFTAWKKLFPSEERAVATVDRLVDQATILRFTGLSNRGPREITGAPLDE